MPISVNCAVSTGTVACTPDPTEVVDLRPLLVGLGDETLGQDGVAPAGRERRLLLQLGAALGGTGHGVGQLGVHLERIDLTLDPTHHVGRPELGVQGLDRLLVPLHRQA